MLFLVNSCVWSLLLVSQPHKKRRCHYRRHSGDKRRCRGEKEEMQKREEKKMFLLLLPQRSLSPSLKQAQYPTVIVRNNCPQQLTRWTSRLNRQPKYLQSIPTTKKQSYLEQSHCLSVGKSREQSINTKETNIWGWRAQKQLSVWFLFQI